MVITVKIAGAVIISNAKGQVDCFVNTEKAFTLPPRTVRPNVHNNPNDEAFRKRFLNRRNLKRPVLCFNSVNGEHFENKVFRKFFVVVRTENL